MCKITIDNRTRSWTKVRVGMGRDFSWWTHRFPVKSLPHRSRRTNTIILAWLPRISQLICSLLCYVATMLTRPLCGVGGRSERGAGWNQLSRQCVNACHSVPYCNQVWPIATMRLNCMNNVKRLIITCHCFDAVAQLLRFRQDLRCSSFISRLPIFMQICIFVNTIYNVELW